MPTVASLTKPIGSSAPVRRIGGTDWCVWNLSLILLCSLASSVSAGWAVGVKAGRVTPGHLVLMSSDNKEVLLDNGSCFGAAFSPNLSEVAYVRGSDIYIIGVDASGRRQVKSGGMTNNGNYANTLSWCDNGFLYYSRGWSIYRVPIAGGGEELVHTSRFSNKGDAIRQLQVCRNAGRAGSWGRPDLDNGNEDGHAIVYTLGTPANDKRWDNHCMGAISKSGTYFNATYASHAKCAVFIFDQAPSSSSANGGTPDNLGITPYRVLSRRSGYMQMNRFSQCDEDIMCWLEDSKGYAVRVSTGETVAGPWNGFTPQDYSIAPLNSSTGPSILITEPHQGAIRLPAETVTIVASVSPGDAAVSRVDFAVDNVTIETKTAAPWQTSWTAAGEGAHTVIATVTDVQGMKAGDTVTIQVARLYAFPDSIPHMIPGRIEAEHFDLGGKGIAYHDASAGNSGGAARTAEDVDISHGGTGLVVTSTQVGEWLRYSITIPQQRDYIIAVALAGGSTSARMHLELNGDDITGPIAMATGGVASFAEFVKDNVVLPAGNHVLTAVFDAAGYAFDYIDIRVPADPIVLHSPGGGETLRVGETMIVEWSCDTTLVTDVHIEFSTDGGLNWDDLSARKLGRSINVGSDEWGRFSFTLTDQEISAEAIVCVREYGGNRLAASNPFVVTAGAPVIVKQQGGTHGIAVDIRPNPAGFSIANPTGFRVRLLDVRGRTTYRTTSSSSKAPLTRGVYVAEIGTDFKDRVVRKVVRN